MQYHHLQCVFILCRQGKIFDKSAIQSSRVYPVVAPLGPKVIDWFWQADPAFKDTFTQLESFSKPYRTKYSSKFEALFYLM